MTSQPESLMIDSRSDRNEFVCSDAKCELGMASARDETANGVTKPDRIAKQEGKKQNERRKSKIESIRKRIR